MALAFVADRRIRLRRDQRRAARCPHAFDSRIAAIDYVRVSTPQQVRQDWECALALRARDHVPDSRNWPAVQRRCGISFKYLAAVGRGVPDANNAAFRQVALSQHCFV